LVLSSEKTPCFLDHLPTLPLLPARMDPATTPADGMAQDIEAALHAAG
jgi:hypothetical protein